MQNQIFSIYHLSISSADFAAFEELVQRIVAATSKEADTTIYEYVVNAGHTVVHIIERYRIAGLLPRVEQTFTRFAKRFLLFTGAKRGARAPAATSRQHASKCAHEN